MRSSSSGDEGNASRRRYEQPVGLIGLGLMGMAPAERLRSGGLDVWGYDIDASREVFSAGLAASPPRAPAGSSPRARWPSGSAATSPKWAP